MSISIDKSLEKYQPSYDAYRIDQELEVSLYYRELREQERIKEINSKGVKID